MEKTDGPLTDQEKRFLEKMFGDREFLKNPDAKVYDKPPEEALYILKGPSGQAADQDDDIHRIFNDAWGMLGGGDEPTELRWLDGFVSHLFFYALQEGKRTEQDEKLWTHLEELENEHNKMGNLRHYAFTELLTLLYARALRIERDQHPEDESFLVMRRLVNITEDGIRYMNRCAEYIKDFLRVFTFDVDRTLGRYLSEPEWKSKAECFKRYYQDGDKQKIIARDLGISQSSVAKYIDEVQGRLSFEMGQAYEDFFEKNVAPRKYDRYVRMGGKGEPDGIGYKGDRVEVLNLKCHNATRGSSDNKLSSFFLQTFLSNHPWGRRRGRGYLPLFPSTTGGIGSGQRSVRA
nr:hypothetical protein [Candidatus Njordarchaeum guaymaensis]